MRPLSLRSTLTLAAAGLAALLAFTWPLFVAPGSALAGTSTAPLVFALLLPVVIAVAAADLTADGVDVRALAVLGVLTAIGAAVRPLGAGTAGIETVFFVIVLGGRVFGPAFGFVLGNTTLFASALITGGFGPWLPFQMLASAFVGLGAGLLPRVRGWLELVVLVIYGSLSSFGFGLLMDLSSWPYVTVGTDVGYVPGASLTTNLHRFIVFNAVTSLGWNLGRAVTTSVLLVVLGVPLLRTLRRAARRGQFTGAKEPARQTARERRAGMVTSD